MERLKKEQCQVDDTVIQENLVKMSREHGILVTIRTLKGDYFYGTLMCIIPFNAATTGVPALYLQRVIEDSDGNQRHAVIPVSSIDSITFATEKGLLDNLVKQGGRHGLFCHGSGVF